MTPVIQVRGLTYTYDDGTKALDGVDFDLMPGETVALLGANGSGKTTFVLHLNGLLSGTGQITINGIPLSKETLAKTRQRIGLVFQDSDNQLFLPTVEDDVAFGPMNMGLSIAEAKLRAQAALHKVGMSWAARKAPYHLSAGEKKRVAIAGILAMQPEILVLDEPTTFLDPPGQRALIELLGELPQAKILVTHDLAFAETLATRAVFFEKGRIAGEGTVPEVAELFNWKTANRKP